MRGFRYLLKMNRNKKSIIVLIKSIQQIILLLRHLMDKFGEHEIVKLLKHLDKLIDDELEIIMCGGAAGILRHTFSRSTLDIDLLMFNI
jgi:hypothetical protein